MSERTRTRVELAAAASEVAMRAMERTFPDTFTGLSDAQRERIRRAAAEGALEVLRQGWAGS